MATPCYIVYRYDIIFFVEIECQAEQDFFGQFENFFRSCYQKIDINACYYYTGKPLRSSIESLCWTLSKLEQTGHFRRLLKI